MQEKTKIVIVGNGFGGIYTLKYLHKYLCGNPNIHITIIGQKNYFLFTPLIHEVATGGINPENVLEPIRKVLGCCISSFFVGKAEHIDLSQKTVSVNNTTLPYDYLIIATGAETNFYNIKGAQENSLTLKSIEDAIKIKNHIISKMELSSYSQEADKKRALTFSVVGGGPTGVELAAEIKEFIKDSFSKYFNVRDARIVLIHRDAELIPQFGQRLRKKSVEHLRKEGIEVKLNSEVKEVGPSHILLSNGERIETETILWMAGIKPIDLNFDKEIAKTKDGRILVNEFLQVQNEPDVFALGDTAAFSQDGMFLPALAQVASKEGKMVAKNIFNLIRKKPLERFIYRHSGNLLSLGQWMAVGEIKGLTFSGRFTWWVWRTVYLFKMISFKKKLKVALDWTINLFYPRDISEF